MPRCQVLHKAGGIALEDLDVCQSVHVDIVLGVPDSIRVQLDADDTAGMGGCNDTDGPDAAVGIQDSFSAGESRTVDGDIIEFFRHQGIDLIEGAGGDAEALSAEDVFNIAFSVDDSLPVSEDHGRIAVIDIDHDRRDFRMELHKLFNKSIAGRKNRVCQDKGHHDLFCGPGRADLDIAEKPHIQILVIDTDAEVGQELIDGLDDPVRLNMLDQAGLYRYDFMGPLAVDAADRLSLTVRCKD